MPFKYGIIRIYVTLFFINITKGSYSYVKNSVHHRRSGEW